MRNLAVRASKFWNDDRGLETVEYAVMTALIAVALVTAGTGLALAMGARFEFVSGII